MRVRVCCPRARPPGLGVTSLLRSIFRHVTFSRAAPPLGGWRLRPASHFAKRGAAACQRVARGIDVPGAAGSRLGCGPQIPVRNKPGGDMLAR